MTWSKDESQLDAQLAELFQKDIAMPAPVVQTQTLERMRRQREQNGLLAAVSVLSFLWFAVYLLTGVLLLELDWLWGVRCCCLYWPVCAAQVCWLLRCCGQSSKNRRYI